MILLCVCCYTCVALYTGDTGRGGVEREREREKERKRERERVREGV
jgi:hypothetical protein